MQQENWHEYGSSLQLVESWKHVELCDNPKHQSAEYKIDGEYVHAAPTIDRRVCSTADTETTIQIPRASVSLDPLVKKGCNHRDQQIRSIHDSQVCRCWKDSKFIGGGCHEVR